VADGTEPCQTLGKITEQTFNSRTEKVVRKYQLNQIKPILWLDRMTFPEVNKLNKTRETGESEIALVVRFDSKDSFQHPIFHSALKRLDVKKYPTVPAPGSLVTFRDPDMELENSCEQMAIRLMSSSHRVVDPKAQPNRSEQDKILRILNYSPLAHTTIDENHLMWRYRHWLQNNKRGFVKFMRCVSWDDRQDSEIASQLIDDWGGLTIEDCLECLGRRFRGQEQVRRHAVKRLSEFGDAEFSEVLLQLVQGLRYERDLRPGPQQQPHPCSGDLFKLLLKRSVVNWASCSTLYWYLSVETEDPSPDFAEMFRALKERLLSHLDEHKPLFHARLDQQQRLIKCFHRLQDGIKNVSGHKSKAKKVEQLLAIGDCGVKECFGKYEKYRDLLEPAHKEKEPKALQNQIRDRMGGLVKGGRKVMGAFTKHHAEAHEDCHPDGDAADRSAHERSHEDVATVITEEEDEEGETSSQPMVTNPLEPTIELCGISDRKDSVIVFKSAKMPLLLEFIRAEDQGPCRMMYKCGDDIRQDQLVLQLISVMDRLLRQDGLDLHLIPYKALSLSVSDGMMEPVPNAVNLQNIIDGIPNHLRKFECNWPKDGEKGEFTGPVPDRPELGPRSLSKRCLDSWTRSNAGYAVITFILGIGDRHLENLMVTNEGRLFHIDFGFILGKDPKPFPPPLKLRQEQVDAMGGTEHPRFAEFKTLCCTAYNIVRKHANFILTLLQLMSDANIPDLIEDRPTTKEPGDKHRVNMRIQEVENKMRLDLNEAEATRHMQEQLDSSISSWAGRIHDRAHIIAAALPWKQ